MSTLPEHLPEEQETSNLLASDLIPDSETISQEPLKDELSTLDAILGSTAEHVAETPLVVEAPDTVFEPPLFASYSAPAYIRPMRIPHMGHLGIFLLLLCFGWLAAGLLLLLGLHFHLFGVSSFLDAATDYRYALGTQAIQYLFSFAGCLVVFPIIWHKGLLEGLQWRGATAMKLQGRLITLAVFCFFAAMLNGMLMPGPTDAPIDHLFRAPGAAWVLFGFGVTLAPFFEELAFRGFLLPALCTAYDWIVEQTTGAPVRPVDENDHPQWSLPAMAVASVLTSIPFALMHGEQTGYSLGPFVLLIFISLVLCWTRLFTRSLAASTMVHACYNFLLFSFMLLGTGGFKHLDRM